MIRGVAVLLGAGLLIVAAQASEGPDDAAPPSDGPTAGSPFEAGHWAAAAASAPRSVEPAVEDQAEPAVDDGDYDVVDAHWMALTMWGEARGAGEAAMRAVGHVIDNRRRAGGRHGHHVTNTVSAAWQFSCWNAGDPNRVAIDRIDRLDPAGTDHRMWLAARRIAAEIMAGGSTDPTGGALFYHSQTVSPAWSRGLAPVAQIGPHLFFTRAL